MEKNQTELQKALRDYLDKNPGKEREIASKLGFMPGTIVRWLEGKTSPPPDVVQGVIQKLSRMESEKTSSQRNKTRITCGPGYMTLHTDVEAKTLEKVVWLAKNNFPDIPFDKIELIGGEDLNGGMVTLETRAEKRRK